MSESVYRDRDLMLDLESVIELTSDTFQTAVTQNDITVVLFYFKCEFNFVLLYLMYKKSLP